MSFHRLENRSLVLEEPETMGQKITSVEIVIMKACNVILKRIQKKPHMFGLVFDSFCQG